VRYSPINSLGGGFTYCGNRIPTDGKEFKREIQGEETNTKATKISKLFSQGKRSHLEISAGGRGHLNKKSGSTLGWVARKEWKLCKRTRGLGTGPRRVHEDTRKISRG